MNSTQSSAPNTPGQVSNFQWRVAIGSLIASFVLTAVLLIAALAGVSDPRPLGEQVWADEFKSNEGWFTFDSVSQMDVALNHGELSLAPNTVILVQSPHRLHLPGSLILFCRQESGSPDAGFGIWIASEGRTPLVIAINSDTYVGIFEPPPSNADQIRPWHVFPHVKKTGQSNKFQLDFERGMLTIWLNDERVAQFEYANASLLSIGLYADTVDRGAGFNFERLEGWQK